MYSWDLIRVFLAIHRCGNYEDAAHLLGVDVSTTRRKLQMLEAGTGMPLFVRRAGRFVLAPDRDIMLQAALQMEKAALMFDLHADDGQQGGRVRVSALDFVAGLIAPHVAGFCEAYPKVVLNLTTEPHFVDLEREMIDIALRLARPTRGGDGLKKLATMGFSVYGSDAYIAEHPETSEQGHNILSLTANFAHQDHEFELADEHWFKLQHRIGEVVSAAGSYLVTQQLCESGLGLALLPDILARESPKIRRFGDARFHMDIDLWIVIRKDIAHVPKIRTTINFLTKVFKQMAATL